MEITNEVNQPNQSAASELVPTGAHLFAPWMTVQEAVAYCVSKGLPRTPKTVRKWAQRSIESVTGTGDVVVQRQDTENGFRWLISQELLDVKIDQEKEHALRNAAETDNENTSEPVGTGAHVFEQVATGANRSAQVAVNELDSEPIQLHENTSEPVGTGAHEAGTAQRNSRPENLEILNLLKKQLERAERQLDVKDKQIDALLERDRETNVLIQGLQTSLTGVVNALPSGSSADRVPPRSYTPIHSEQGTQIRDS